MNLVQFLREKNVYDLHLPPDLSQKLIEANLIELTKIYSAIQGYKALGIWTAESLSTDEIKLLAGQVNSLMVEYGFAKPLKPSTPSVTQTSVTPSRTTPPVKRNPGEVRPAPVHPEQKTRAPEKGITREVPSRQNVIASQQSSGPTPAKTTHPAGAQTSPLAKWEEQFSPLIYQVKLVGEVAITPEALTNLSIDFQRLFYNRHQQEVLDLIFQSYPAAFLVFLVGHGIYGYQGGDYWESVEKALNCKVDQVALGRLFERLLRWFRLPLFPELQERAFRYVSPILAHGGIPVYSLQDFFSQIVFPCATRPQLIGLDGDELVDEVLKSSAGRTVDKPIHYFFEYCGQAAINLLERSRTTLLAWQKSPRDVFADETGLPAHIVAFFNEWARKYAIDAPMITGARGRYKRPEMCLDPWGMGIYLRLPAQPVSNLAGGSVVWDVQAGEAYHEEFQPRNLRNGDRFETKEMMVRLAQMADQITVRFQVSSQEFHWSIQGYSPDHPLLAFDPERGNLLNHIFARENWLLIPKHYELRVIEGEGYLLEYLPPLPGQWSRLRGECWDLAQARKIGLFQDGQLVRDVIVRGQEKVQPPRLEEGRLLPDDSEQSEIPLYCGKLPLLKVPLSRPDDGQAELRRWRVNIEPAGEAIPNHTITACLADLDQATVRLEGDTATVLLDQPTLLGVRPTGTFNITLNGPLGHDAHFRFNFLPEFEVVGNNRLYIPDPAQGATTALLNIRTGLLDKIVPVSVSDGITMRQERPGQHIIEVPGPVSTARLLLVRETIQEAAVRVPVHLRIRRLRWRLVRENGLVDQWMTRSISIPAPILLQDQSPLLIVDLPQDNDKENFIGLELVLKDVQGNMLQQLQPADRNSQRAGRFWRFDLNDLKHIVDVSASPVFRLELVGKKKDAQAVPFVLPVMALTKEIQIHQVEGEGYSSQQMSHFYLSWKEAFRLRSRAIYLWSLFRPWVPPLVVGIPDEVDQEYEFSLSGDTVVGGWYRAAIVVVDPWASPPPPAVPPPPGSPGTIDIELTLAEDRLKILRREIGSSTARITTQIAYRMEASLICRALGDLLAAQHDLTWCCQNASMMSVRELLALEDVLSTGEASDLRAALSKSLMQPDLIERVLQSLQDGGISPEEFHALLSLAPSACDWPIETCSKLVKVDDRAVRYQSLQQLLNRDVQKAVEAVLFLMEDMALSLDDAVEFLDVEKPLALEQLRTKAHENRQANLLMQALSRFNYYSGLPQVKPGTWVLTNAGWGQIDEILDPRTQYSIDAFMEGDGAYILGVQLHLNEDEIGEKIVIDMGKQEIYFPRAERVYSCNCCCQFISTNLKRFKKHHAQHGMIDMSPPIHANKIRLSVLQFHSLRK